MNVSLDARWQDFVDGVVREGRYGSAEEVVREGLRLVEAREAKLAALRADIHEAIAEGGELTDEEVGEAIEARLREIQTRQPAG